jgi:hypothetical protein
MSIIRTLLFAWGCLAALIMAFYSISWVVQADNPLRNEFGFGFGIGLIYGSPSWLGLPILAFIGRRELGRSGVLIVLSPVIVAFASFVLLAVMGGI